MFFFLDISGENMKENLKKNLPFENKRIWEIFTGVKCDN